MARASSNTDAYLCDCWGEKKEKEKTAIFGYAAHDCSCFWFNSDLWPYYVINIYSIHTSGSTALSGVTDIVRTERELYLKS